MRGYSQLADIESLLLNIPNKNIRAYAGEAIASYSAGAYRSAIVSIWITVVYDLYQKFRLLDEQYDDKAAKICIDKIDKIRDSPDRKQVTAWEREILSKAYKNVKIITSTEYDHLDRIQKDRHRCAHPVLDNEGFLFQPTPELVRTHIRTAIEVLLSQPPIIGKAAEIALIRDIEETNLFPDDLAGVKKILFKRHFRFSEKYRQNILKLSLKKILCEDNSFAKEDFTKRYMLVFQCLLKEYRTTLESLDKEVIFKIISRTKEIRYKLFLHIVYEEPTIWNCTPEFIQEKIKIYCLSLKINNNNNSCIYELLYATVIVDGIEGIVLERYLKLEIDIKKLFIEHLKTINYSNRNYSFIKKIVAKNIEIFCNSSSFAEGRSNAYLLILPIIEMLDKDNIKLILSLSITKQEFGYDQLQDCTFCFKEIFQKTIDQCPSTLENWKNFVDKKSEKFWGEEFSQLQELVENKLL